MNGKTPVTPVEHYIDRLAPAARVHEPVSSIGNDPGVMSWAISAAWDSVLWPHGPCSTRSAEREHIRTTIGSRGCRLIQV
jgi:hypothetical protein